MAKQPINNGKVVERSYEDYRNNQYLVNRRYQRKLVWELEEKQAFIFLSKQMADIFALFAAIGFGRHLHDRPVPQRLHRFFSRWPHPANQQ